MIKRDAYERVKEIVDDIKYEEGMYQKALDVNPTMQKWSTCGVNRSKPEGLAILTNAIFCCA